MAKAIYIGSSVCLFVCLLVCLFVCEFVNICFLEVFSLYLCRALHNLNHISDHCRLWQDTSSSTSFEGQGQRSRSGWPVSQNHVNQFFSNSFDPIFAKLGEKIALSGAHNRLDFGKDPTNPSGSISGKKVTLKMTLTTISSYPVI